MIVRVYEWEVYGLSGSGNEWKTNGTMMDSFTPVNFPSLLESIMSEVFLKLTKGKAEYGYPGEGGCKGPYKYTKIVIELKEELAAD